ncbi:MAG: 1,4-alpha-glucan branching protein GlgB [Gemmiger sp.]|nr:1,4-alpha-glucan branching protein GlgB [Gemmiger sp.]
MDIQAFYTGHAFDAYEFFGAHPYPGGVHFAVWAPAARAVAVATDGGDVYPLHPSYSAVWEGDCPGLGVGTRYHYRITGGDGSTVDHCDPYGRAMALRPDSHSIVVDGAPYPFTDAKWMAARNKNFDAPMNIYEAHLGSWRQKPDGGWYTYKELAALLPPYLKENGYTHLELMPLAEYPFDGSWGYQTTGFYAPTSRYGTPAALCALVDACHRQEIGVILDFVPVHFAVDGYGLKRFDGTPLYEYPAATVGESEWGSCNFMHSRGEIRCFVQSCAAYWLQTFHADGLRMDAVSRLLYWQGDPARGVNTSTVEFLKGMNAGLQQRYPTALLIAEDSTNYPKVTAPVEYGGLGFDYKWDLGWMNDTLDYFKKTPAERRDNFGKLSFSMVYCWNEHYILPFSHDENVHGKATILQKMYGGYDGKFPQGRLLYLYMMLHPGKKLDFMGNELGQLREWDEARQQDWELVKYPLHDAFAHYRRALGLLYAKYDAFWQGEYDPARFQWLDCDATHRCACTILRRGEQTTLVGVFHFGDAPLAGYTVALPGPGKLTLLLDTDWQPWGGATPQPKTRRAAKTDGQLTVDLPPYSGQLYAFAPLAAPAGQA